MSVELIVSIALNLVGFGVAYGLIRGRLDALEKAEKDLRAEVILTRERIHELTNRMSSLVLEIVKMRGNGK